MSHDEIITNNVKEEFDAFKKEQISKMPITIFENAGKIHFYKEIFTYILCTSILHFLRMLWKESSEVSLNLTVTD